ncbi:MAG: hypothetical protein Q9185_003573 [Variospora sp. 1 TL-2023]
MKLFPLLFAFFNLTLALAKPKCTCAVVRCPGTQPELCECENAAAIACFNQCRGPPPKLKPCPVPSSIITTTQPPKPTSTPCGSRGMTPCAADQYCIADPNDLECSLIADCPGLCVKFNGPVCGGFANLQCPSKDQVCVEDPRDSCDPGAGGADCSGACVRLDGSSSA